MSAKLRAKLWSEINTNWARSKGMSGSRGGAYFNQGEVRIVKSQFDNKMRKILEKLVGSAAITPVPVVDTDFADLRAFLNTYINAENAKNNAWELAKKQKSVGKADLITISYVRGLTKKGKPKVGNIEQSFQKVVKDGIKAYLKKKGAEVTNMEYEHGKTRESGFKRTAQRKGLFSKKETDFPGSQGSNAEQVSFMELDKFIKGKGSDLISKDKRLVTSVDKTITFGLDKIFGINTDQRADRNANGYKDTLIMQGEVVPVEDKNNPGTVDKTIKDQVELLLNDQRTFIKAAIESGAKKDPRTALAFFHSSPHPIDALGALGNKQIIDKMFSHKTNPDMRLRVNKSLARKGRKATTKSRTKTSTKTKRGIYKNKTRRASAAGAVKGATLRTPDSPLTLKALLNDVLPEAIAANMTSPALRFRTGRFANSVRVDNITQGPRGGNTLIETSYLKDPYETFAPGGKKYTFQRNPERLIKGTVRQVATGILGGRFSVGVN